MFILLFGGDGQDEEESKPDPYPKSPFPPSKGSKKASPSNAPASKREPLPFTPELSKTPASKCKPRKTTKIRDGVDDVDIVSQFDGSIDKFGVAFWEEIKLLVPDYSRSRLIRVVYEDQHLLTPLRCRLLWEVLRKAPGRGANSKIEIISMEASDAPSDDRMSFHLIWPDPQMRIKVIRGLFVGANIEFRKKEECAHYRQLYLEFEGERWLQIRLDAGLGAWGCRWIPFNADLPVDHQVAMIKKVKTKVIIRDKKHPTPLSLQWGHFNSNYRSSRDDRKSQAEGFQIESGGELLIFTPSGRLDSTNSRDLGELLKSEIEDRKCSVLLDCRDLHYISSAELRTILLIAKSARDCNANLALCSISDNIKEVFEISGFDRIIPIHKSREDAIQSLQG